MILKRVIWPEPDSDEDEAQFNLEQSCDVTAFLREYIQTGKQVFFLIIIISLMHVQYSAADDCM